ncbi:vesicle transport protein [Klebsormidium nitens]|uniref:Vesicle transport protein n=1 Tax=Klebsormidium nitens TaxID=105231 RepID=A0A1Y1HSN6_KLENI|nr:vesicle transport protein [Klebsormidium nitens]|eukprot:GAQ81123.1 vesicle transport protein [Klebsormidium nitens]
MGENMFQSYERQYTELLASLKRKVENVSLLSGEQKKQKLKELQQGIDESEALIRKMDLEARSFSKAELVTLKSKLAEYKAGLNNVKKEAKKASAALPDEVAARQELMERGLGEPLGSVSADQRNRLLQTTDRLNQSGERIKESKRVAIETEDIGAQILGSLSQQRETLLHARGTLHGVDDNIGKSRQILNRMAQRIRTNKIIMYGIIAALVFAIILILYFKFKKH